MMNEDESKMVLKSTLFNDQRHIRTDALAYRKELNTLFGYMFTIGLVLSTDLFPNLNQISPDHD